MRTMRGIPSVDTPVTKRAVICKSSQKKVKNNTENMLVFSKHLHAVASDNVKIFSDFCFNFCVKSYI